MVRARWWCVCWRGTEQMNYGQHFHLMCRDNMPTNQGIRASTPPTQGGSFKASAMYKGQIFRRPRLDTSQAWRTWELVLLPTDGISDTDRFEDQVLHKHSIVSEMYRDLKVWFKSIDFKATSPLSRSGADIRWSDELGKDRPTGVWTGQQSCGKLCLIRKTSRSIQSVTNRVSVATFDRCLLNTRLCSFIPACDSAIGVAVSMVITPRWSTKVGYAQWLQTWWFRTLSFPWPKQLRSAACGGIDEYLWFQFQGKDTFWQAEAAAMTRLANKDDD